MTVRTPDTWFLQEALSRALGAVGARLDSAQAWRPWFRVALEGEIRPEHDSWDWCDMAGRYVDALCLIRQCIGESLPPEHEAGLWRFLLGSVGDDGLFHNGDGRSEERVADMFCQSRVQIGLWTRWMETEEPRLLELLRRNVAAVSARADRTSGGARFPRNRWRDGGWVDGGLFYDAKDLWTVKPGYGGTQMEGIVPFARGTGDPVASRFAGEFLHFWREVARVVAADGTFAGHLHSQGIVPTMIGVDTWARWHDDAALWDWCGRFVDVLLRNASRFGWVPDGLGWPTCETCALGDVLHLLVRRSRGGDDRWDAVERFARNQLVENQFRDPSLVLANRPFDPRVPSILNGGFASWAHPDDLLGGPDIEGCCLGGGIRAIFHVLENAVARGPEGTIDVHLRISVDHAEAFVTDAAPVRGLTEVRPHRRAVVRVRVPEGVEPEACAMRLDGRAVEGVVGGRYLATPKAVEAGTVVALEYPLPEAEWVEQIAGRAIRSRWRGATVVALEALDGRPAQVPTYGRDRWVHRAAGEVERRPTRPNRPTRIVW